MMYSISTTQTKQNQSGATTCADHDCNIINGSTDIRSPRKHAVSWSLSSKERNRQIHALNGNIKGGRSRSARPKRKGTTKKKSGARKSGKPPTRYRSPMPSGPGQLSAPVGYSQRLTTKEAVMVPTRYGQIVRHSELVGDVVSTATPSVFALKDYTVNPAYTGPTRVFTWLTAIASRYEMYRVRSLRFRYVPRTGTDTNVAIIMGANYNPTDAPASDEKSFMAYTGSVEDIAWTTINFECDGGSLHSAADWLYNRESSTAGDRRLYDAATFFIGVINGQASTTYGKLFVDYDIEFKTAIIPPTLVNPANMAVVYTDAIVSPPVSTTTRLPLDVAVTLCEGVTFNADDTVTLGPGCWKIRGDLVAYAAPSTGTPGATACNIFDLNVNGTQTVRDQNDIVVPTAGTQSFVWNHVINTLVTVAEGATKIIDFTYKLGAANSFNPGDISIAGGNFKTGVTFEEVLLGAAETAWSLAFLVPDPPAAVAEAQPRYTPGWARRHPLQLKALEKEWPTEVTLSPLTPRPGDSKIKDINLTPRERDPGVRVEATGPLGNATIIRHNVPGPCILDLGLASILEVEDEDKIYAGLIGGAVKALHVSDQSLPGFVLVTASNRKEIEAAYGEPGQTEVGHFSR